jgi:hypothetical protein
MVIIGKKPISRETTEKIIKTFKSICKIIINREGNTKFGTGFFMRVSDNLKYLITCHHIISQEMNNINIELEIWNKKIMKLTFDERFKYFQESLDITAIEIKEKDNIYEDVIFLDYDSNNIKGYSIYKNEDIFSICYHNGEQMFSLGNILDINDYEFLHDTNLGVGSSGSPIISLNNFKVIGIHEGYVNHKKINYATFIGEIIKEILIPNKTTSQDKNKIFSNNNNCKILNNNINNNLKINHNQNLINNNFNQNKINSKENINSYPNKNQPLNNKSDISKTNNNTINLSKNSVEIKKKENLLVLTNDSKDAITLHFNSSDQLLNYAVRCKNTDKFNMVMNKILEKEPKIIEKEFYFISKGNKVKEYKTIKDNNLKDGDTVILLYYE